MSPHLPPWLAGSTSRRSDRLWRRVSTWPHKRRAVLAGIAAVVVAIGMWRSRPSVESAHMFKSGACNDCHDQPPTYHRVTNYALNHGRDTSELRERCETCHDRSTCIDCHQRPPASHTSGFRRPGGEPTISGRHVCTADARPATCLVCHREPAAECGRCHALDEVEQFHRRAASRLDVWRDQLGDWP